jgi:uncharacterized membrane protein YraQ (UPF0718 family)
MADTAELSRVHDRRTEPEERAWRYPLLLLVVLATTGLVLHLADPSRVPAVRNFVVVFGALVIGAMPLILLGAFAAAVIGVFVPTSLFERLARLPEVLQLPAAGAAGFAFPVCECGSVPVARRLLDRGMTPAAAVTFMLAAPILNPIVIVSTAVAYRGRDIFWPMVLGRVGLGLVAAMVVGWVVGALRKNELVPALGAFADARRRGDDAGHDAAVDGHGHHDHAGSEGPRWEAFFSYFVHDVVFMGRFLIFGAAVAGALQTVVPQSVLGSVAGTPVLDLIALMGLAFVLSLCSESDAFVAASFVQFGVGAQLAFLVFGPMVDTKLAFLYSATFSRRFFLAVTAAVTVVTLAGTLWIEVLIG